jgi:hypothetical protein
VSLAERNQPDFNVMKEKIALALFVLTALLTAAWSVYPLPDAEGRLQALPARGFNFSSRDMPLATDEVAVLGEAGVIKRLYQVGDQCFVMTVVDSTRNRHAVHDPAYCYRGAGWTVESRVAYPVPGGTAALLTLLRGGARQQVMFWMSDDRTRYAQPLRYWWQATLRRITLNHSGSAPVLVILQPAAAGAFDWHRLTESFPQLFEF